jgi:hypothetical protein
MRPFDFFSFFFIDSLKYMLTFGVSNTKRYYDKAIWE